MRIQVAIGVSGIAGCLACSAGGLDEPTMEHYLAEMDATLEVAEQALSSHHETVIHEADLERVWELEGHHLDDMTDHMQDFDEARLSMEACGAAMHRADRRRSFDVAAMARAGDELRDDIELHWHNMLAAPNLDAALREEARHRGGMLELFERMHGYGADLTDSVPAGEFLCPMHSHTHGMTARD